ncbi:MAG: PriCT-2 domain-containing protein, partial [Bacteroidales bacterium]|nr:PriCT-2 domain-containing protein [Bacteroidales bacterium]
EHWFKIGCAFAHEFGEEGRDWFTKVSRMSDKFGEGDCDIQYSRCLKYKKEAGVTIATFFYYCKKHGIKYRKKQ